MHLVTLVRSFRCCDVDVDPMTLVYDLVLDIPKMYMYKKNKFPRSRLSKVRARTIQTDTQTDAKEGITTQHSRVVKKLKKGSVYKAVTGFLF